MFDAVIDVIRIVMAKHFIEAVVTGGQGLVLRLVGGLGQRLGGPDHVVMGGDQFVQGGTGLVEQGPARLEFRLLP